MGSLVFEIESDVRFQSYVVNKIIPFPVMLEKAGFDGYSYEGKVYCPFHDNYETPAAKIYKDREGDTLWCFSENRRYYPSEVLKRGMVKNNSLTSIFTKLWNSFSDERKKSLIEGYDKPVSYIPEIWKQNEDKLYLFKAGKIPLDKHLELIRQCMV